MTKMWQTYPKYGKHVHCAVIRPKTWQTFPKYSKQAQNMANMPTMKQSQPKDGNFSEEMENMLKKTANMFRTGQTYLQCIIYSKKYEHPQTILQGVYSEIDLINRFYWNLDYLLGVV